MRWLLLCTLLFTKSIAYYFAHFATVNIQSASDWCHSDGRYLASTQSVESTNELNELCILHILYHAQSQMEGFKHLCWIGLVLYFENIDFSYSWMDGANVDKSVILKNDASDGYPITDDASNYSHTSINELC